MLCAGVYPPRAGAADGELGGRHGARHHRPGRYLHPLQLPGPVVSTHHNLLSTETKT